MVWSECKSIGSPAQWSLGGRIRVWRLATVLRIEAGLVIRGVIPVTKLSLLVEDTALCKQQVLSNPIQVQVEVIEAQSVPGEAYAWKTSYS